MWHTISLGWVIACRVTGRCINMHVDSRMLQGGQGEGVCACWGSLCLEAAQVVGRGAAAVGSADDGAGARARRRLRLAKVQLGVQQRQRQRRRVVPGGRGTIEGQTRLHVADCSPAPVSSSALADISKGGRSTTQQLPYHSTFVDVGGSRRRSKVCANKALSKVNAHLKAEGSSAMSRTRKSATKGSSQVVPSTSALASGRITMHVCSPAGGQSAALEATVALPRKWQIGGGTEHVLDEAPVSFQNASAKRHFIFVQ